MAAPKHRSLRLFAAIWLIGSFLAIPPAGAVAAARCDGETITLAGTPGSDTLTGTAGRDVIHGFGGNDVINGLGGDDLICAGAGNDTVRGGDGNDRLFGQDGNDAIFGNGGDDSILAGTGTDTVEGGTGADSIRGSDGDDVLNGGDGPDVIRGESGADQLHGGSGSDTLRGSGGNDKLVGGRGHDNLIGGDGIDKLYGNRGEDLLDGGKGPDKAWGGPDWDDCYSATRNDPCEGPVFLETFDGEPASPTPFKSTDTITVSTNSRIGSTRDTLASMQADHGADCAGPPARHTVTQYADAQYRCHGHMMTAISSGASHLDNYAVSMFSPNAILDFSADEAVIQFDVSTLRRSKRDWFEVWITPYADLQRIPVQDRPTLQGPPKNGVVVALKSFTDTGSFDVEVHRNFNELQIDGPVEWIGYEDFLTPSPTVRSKFEIRITQDHIIVGMPDVPFYWISEEIPGGLPFDKGVVQFGHNSYDVFDCEGCGVGPNTWHWDNIYMAPAEPITALAADRRHVDDSSPSFVTFASPAPARAQLQFTGVGFDLEVSFDNGLSWQPAVTQHNREIHNWRYKNYSMPVPAGTTRVDFRGNDPYDGHWQIQDIAILSRQTPAGAYDLDATMGDLAIELQSLPAVGCLECVGNR